MAKQYNYLDRFPKIPCQLYEGTRTEYTGQTDDGGKTTLGVYSAELEKGDWVKLKDHTTNGTILVEIVAAGDDQAHGILIDDPIGEDTVTASGGTPAAAQRRVGTVAFFGLGVVEMTVSATGAVSPGDRVGQDADEVMEVEQQTAYSSIDGEDDPGTWISLGYGAAGYKVPVLIGASMSCKN